MGRIRTIKPEFPQSESMGRVSRDARLCFILLWTLADDAGKLRGNSRMLASLLYPYDDDAKSLIDGWLGELEAEHCIERHSINGDAYVLIRNWLIHQKIDKPSKSKLPDFVESSRILANPRGGIKDQGSRIKDQDQGKGSGTQDMSSSKQLDPPPPNPVDVIFDHWRKVWNHPKSQLDGKRRKAILAALKLGYTVDDLCESIAGYLQSPHHRGENDRQTVYDSIDLLLRDASHIDAGLAFTRGPPPQTSDLTRHNVAVLSKWTPPEVINEARRPKQISGGNGELGGGIRKGLIAGTG